MEAGRRTTLCDLPAGEMVHPKSYAVEKLSLVWSTAEYLAPDAIAPA